MIWGFGQRKKMLPIGVDLGTGEAKLVQLAVESDDIDVQAAASVSIPLHLRGDQIGRLEFLRQNLPGVLRMHPFKGRQCVMALPSDCSFVRHVKVPRMNPKATEVAVQEAAAKDLPYPLDDAVFRYIVAGEVYSEGERVQEVIVVAVPLATLDAYLKMSHQVGLEVVGVNVEPIATVDCFTGLFSWARDPERKTMYVNLRYSNSLAVISHGSDVVFARNLPFGAHQVDELIAKGLDITPEEAHDLRIALREGEPVDYGEDEIYRCVSIWVDKMTRDLDHCLMYYRSAFRPHQVQRVIFTGIQAMDKRLCQMLAQRLNLPAQVGDPLMGLRSGAGHIAGWAGEPQPGFAVAVGLSLGGAG